MENKIGNVQSYTNSNDNLLIKSSSALYAESFYFNNVLDEKAVNKFIKNTEKLIRTSKEYTGYIALLRSNYDILNYDNMLSNISINDASLEFHHYPFTLYEIVDIVLSYHLIKKDKITSFSLAKEIMELHFKHKVGLVPLTHTLHELAHDGSIFISKTQVFGDYQWFADKYSIALSADNKNKLQQLEEMSSMKIQKDLRGLF